MMSAASYCLDASAARRQRNPNPEYSCSHTSRSDSDSSTCSSCEAWSPEAPLVVIAEAGTPMAAAREGA